MIRHILPAFLVCFLICGACLLLPAWGQDPPGDPGAASDQPVAVPDPLSQEQHQIAEKYRRLEDLIFKMADFEATSNPRRAALLRQAYKQSKDRLTQSQLNSITALLAQQQYKRALDGQEVARKDLQDLLQLLLSEDRSDRLKSETQKIKDHIKELKRLERLQRSVRGRTEGGSDTQELAKDQGQIADRTDDLAQELEQADAEKADSSGSDAADDPSQSDPGDGGQPQDDAGEAPDEAKPADPAPGGEPGADAPPTGDPSESSPDGQSPKSPPGKPAPSPPGDPGAEPAEPGGEPSDAPPGETPAQPTPGGEPGGEPGAEPSGEPGATPSAPQTPPDDDGPAKKRVREAEQKMREAQRNLEEAQRSESVENQTEALRKLQEAIAELEEVLRQLREEEMARVLALLEGRFRRMLEAQLKVYEGTCRSTKSPAISAVGRWIFERTGWPTISAKSPATPIAASPCCWRKGPRSPSRMWWNRCATIWKKSPPGWT
jgi:hypothetical protein